MSKSNVSSDQENLDICDEESNVCFIEPVKSRISQKTLNPKQINLKH